MDEAGKQKRKKVGNRVDERCYLRSRDEAWYFGFPSFLLSLCLIISISVLIPFYLLWADLLVHDHISI